MYLSEFFSKNKSTLLYYMFMMILLLTWSTVGSAPPFVLSLVYIVVLYLPTVQNNSDWTFYVFILFTLVSANHFAPSFMPSVSSNLFVIALLLSFVVPNYRSFKLPVPFILLVVLMIIVEMLSEDADYNLVFFLGMLILLSRIINVNPDNICHLFSSIFIISSFIISVDFLINGSRFAYEFDTTSAGTLTRQEWSDSNYFGCFLGMGIVASCIELASGLIENKKVRSFLFLTILFSIIGLLKVASRGAFISIGVSLIAMLIFVKMESGFKRNFLLIGVALIIIINAFGGFDLLFARFMDDDGTAGDRTLIWVQKINSFISEGGFFEYLFGFGRSAGRQLGFGYFQGFHNDYVAVLVEYGIVGLILFISLFLYPLLAFSMSDKNVWVAFIYLSSVSMSLEPFVSGQIGELVFFLYCIALAKYPLSESQTYIK